MKTFSAIGFILTLFIGINGWSQTQDPDQNPNYKISQDKYAEKADDLNSTQGTTIQDTYEAFDWTEYKTQKKQNRKDNRYNRRVMKYQYRYYNNSYNNCNSGYYNYGNYNNGYYNNGYYNGGYYNNPYNYSNGFYNTLLLGSALYYLFN